MTPLASLTARVELLERQYRTLSMADTEILAELRELRADMARQLKTYCDELLSVHRAVLKVYRKKQSRKAARSDHE